MCECVWVLCGYLCAQGQKTVPDAVKMESQKDESNLRVLGPEPGSP